MRKKKPRYHHGDLRRALIDSGIEILETEGLDKLSLRHVARKTGVSQTAPYSHFKDKDALLASIAEVGFTRFTEELLNQARGIDDPRERLLALERGYINFALQNRALFRLMFGPRWEKVEDYPELQAVAEGSFRLLLDTVTDLIGEPADEQRRLLAATSAWSIVHGLANLMLDGQICPERIGAIDTGTLAALVVEPLILGLMNR